MADLNPRILCLSETAYAPARTLADAMSLPLEGRVGRVAEADSSFDNALDHARDCFAAGHPVIGFCAAGILIRAVAPLLNDKRAEPPVIAVSNDGTVIPLLGGHRGANRLAAHIAQIINGHAAITTAGDAALGLALDEPPAGWRLFNPGDAKSVMASLLAGDGAQVTGDEAARAEWLSALPKGEAITIEATMDPVSPPENGLLFHPLRATLGVGCSRNCPPEELADLVHKMLAEAELAPQAIAAIGTVDLKADEPAVLELAKSLDLPLRLFSPAELEAETPNLMNPSDVVFAEIGCHGVSEAAALALTGDEGGLWLGKQKTANATCAIGIARKPIETLTGRGRGRVSLIGIGPGQASWRTPEASQLVAQADALVGYGLYIDLLGPLAQGKERVDFPLGGEEARCRYALEEAGKGRNIALICSGDSGIYAMGALVFELLDRGPDEQGVSAAAQRVEVITTPGVSALQGAAARAGAPLGHDFCAISLSDLLTYREDIIKRIEAAAQGDFVIAFYNPVSKRRRDLLAIARDILLKHRPAETPVLLARSLGRPDESLTYRTLSELEVDEVDMLTVVLVGSSNSRIAKRGDGDRMYTPRGYSRRIDGDLSKAST
jgi:cobalt-precorrin 5A hydrolase/precorrin-3B C17-methyltransferase